MKKNKATDKTENASTLRKEAEAFLYRTNPGAYAEGKDMKALFQELQIHQIELEMQNDELKQANLELEKQQLKFSGIYNIAPVGYFVLDKSGIILDVNNAGAALLERSKADVIGYRMESFITGKSSGGFYRFYMKMLSSNTAQRCNAEFKLANGKLLHAQLEGITIQAIENNPVECYVAVIDISDRIKTEIKFAEITERLELSLKASLAGTWELDLETMNLFLDDSSQKMCNIPEGGFADSFDHFMQLIHPDDRKRVEKEFLLCIKNHKEIDLLCRFGDRDNKECYTVIRGHSISTAEPNNRFVGIIMDISEKTQMEKYSSQLKDEYLKKIASATLYTQENERRRISETLHDSVSQLLYGVKIKLGQLDKIKPSSAEISDIDKLLDQAIDETRNISFELAPSILADFGLPATIEELVKRLSSKKLKISADMKGFFKRSDILLETNIYRIVQELLNNSMKHSLASEISIQLTKGKAIEILVKDNGRGYDVNEQEQSTSGSGLSSIKNRLSLYNGSINTVSEQGNGTSVHVKLYESQPA